MIKMKNWIRDHGLEYANSITPRYNIYNLVRPCATPKELTVADQLYTLESANLVDSELIDFTNADGILTYTGSRTVTMLFNGAAYVEVDKACELSFELHVNDVLVAGGITVRDIVSQDKVTGMNNNTIITLNQGDVIKVKARSTIAVTTLTVNTIDLTMIMGS